MVTERAVVDGRLPNELLGGFYRRIDDLIRRMDEGTLEYWLVMNAIQKIIEGELPSSKK